VSGGEPVFPDPLGVREVVRPGATAHKAGLDVVRRLQALEQGALGRPGPGVVDGSVPVASAAAQGRAVWTANPLHAVQTFNGGGTISATAGELVVITAAGTLTLPAAAIGLRLQIHNYHSASITVQRAGSDTLTTASATGTTSQTLATKNMAIVTCVTAGVWAWQDDS